MAEVYQVTLKLIVVSHNDSLEPPASWGLERLVENALEREAYFERLVSENEDDLLLRRNSLGNPHADGGE